MNPKIDVNSLSVGKSKNDQNSFIKYDIEVSLDEVESSDSGIKLKYGFNLVSNPKNSRINVEGFVSIDGNQSEISEYLNKDENNVPRIVSVVYQELFPFFYMIARTMQIPCPAYHLSVGSAVAKNKAEITPEKIEEKPTDSLVEVAPESQIGLNEDIEPLIEPQQIQESIIQESIIKEPSVSST